MLKKLLVGNNGSGSFAVLTTFYYGNIYPFSKYAPACDCIPSLTVESGKSFAPGAVSFMDTTASRGTIPFTLNRAQ